jgi:hypothetical protein
LTNYDDGSREELAYAGYFQHKQINLFAGVLGWLIAVPD